MKTAQPTPRPVLFQGERALVITGLLGFLLAALCAVFILIGGAERGLEGDVSKAFSFNAALGCFLLSTAAVLPLANMKRRGRQLFRRLYIGLALYAYLLETVQHVRGIDPRFTTHGGPIDVLLGNIFALVAVLMVVLYAVMAVRFFRRSVYKARPLLVLGTRYAMLGVMASFSAGIWISALQDADSGGAGMLWLHGLGFHALQLLPAAAWLAELQRPVITGRIARKRVHGAGLTYLAGLLLVGVQTAAGGSILSWPVLPVAAAVAFACSAGLTARLAWGAWQSTGTASPAAGNAADAS